MTILKKVFSMSVSVFPESEVFIVVYPELVRHIPGQKTGLPAYVIEAELVPVRIRQQLYSPCIVKLRACRIVMPTQQYASLRHPNMMRITFVPVPGNLRLHQAGRIFAKPQHCVSLIINAIARRMNPSIQRRLFQIVFGDQFFQTALYDDVSVNPYRNVISGRKIPVRTYLDYPLLLYLRNASQIFRYRKDLPYAGILDMTVRKANIVYAFVNRQRLH